MSDFSCTIHDESMIAALARLKRIPVSKVIRNAGRDFARAARVETPLASVSRSEYYKYFDQRDRQWHYLHESQVKDRNFAAKRRLYKVRVHKGWSKASWIGVFRALGLPPPAQGKQPDAVARMSQASEMATDYYAEMTIDDAIHFDRFGRNYSAAMVEKIAKAGYEAAAKNITAETQRMLEKQWRGQK